MCQALFDWERGGAVPAVSAMLLAQHWHPAAQQAAAAHPEAQPAPEPETEELLENDLFLLAAQAAQAEAEAAPDAPDGPDEPAV